MLRILTLVLFVFSNLIYAQQQVGDENWEIDLELFENNQLKKQTKKKNKIYTNNELDELKSIDFTSIDELENYNPHYLIKKEIIENEKIIPNYTKPYRALLREGSIIYSTKTKKQINVFRNIYVLAHEEISGGEKIWIYDNKKQKAYFTSSKNVISIEKDLNISESPSTYIEYEKTEGFQSEDDYIILDSYLNLHYEYMTDQYLDDLFSSLIPPGRVLILDTFEALATRFEYKLFYKWDLPVEFGLNFNYQEGRWTGVATGLVWRSFFFGPVAQFLFWKKPKSEWSLQMSYQKSLIFEARSLTENFSFNYSTNALEVNLNYINKMKFGNLVLGGTYRRARASIGKSNVELNRSSERGLMQSWSLLIGFNFETKWNL